MKEGESKEGSSHFNEYSQFDRTPRYKDILEDLKILFIKPSADFKNCHLLVAWDRVFFRP